MTGTKWALGPEHAGHRPGLRPSRARARSARTARRAEQALGLRPIGPVRPFGPYNLRSSARQGGWPFGPAPPCRASGTFGPRPSAVWPSYARGARASMSPIAQGRDDLRSSRPYVRTKTTREACCTTKTRDNTCVVPFGGALKCTNVRS